MRGACEQYRKSGALAPLCHRSMLENCYFLHFIGTNLRKPRIVGKRAERRCLTPASINRTIELLRHMLN